MTVTVLKALLKEKKLRAIHDVLSMYNPVDLAELLSELDDAELATVFRILDKPKAAETFTYMDQDLRQELIKTFSSTEIANLFEELFADDAADFLGDMPANFVTQLLDLGPSGLRLQQGMIDMGQDLFAVHVRSSVVLLAGTAHLCHAHSAQCDRSHRCRCTNNAQHQTGNQECEPFQTTFHNTVPPKMI